MAMASFVNVAKLALCWVVVVALLTQAEGLVLHKSTSCSLQIFNGIVIGPKAYTKSKSTSVDDCCAVCDADAPNCKAFTYEPDEKACYLKNATQPHASRAGAVSGQSPPPPLTQTTVTLSPGIINTVDAHFKSWNIDASPNRQWDSRDLSDPQLHYLASMSEPGFLRFGGSGNDGLPYGVGKPCPPKAGRCLNESHFVRFMEFSEAAGSRLVFGLNIGTRNSSTHRWDPTDARALIKFSQRKGYTFFAFELGNEQNSNLNLSPNSTPNSNSNPSSNSNSYSHTRSRGLESSPNSEALDFQILHDLLTELYPDASTRPKIIGPDIHGFHSMSDVGGNFLKLEFMVDFTNNCSMLGVPLYAITHHEYIEVPQYNDAAPDPMLLDETAAIAKYLSTTMQHVAPGVKLWVGEVGPHNGGSPGCSNQTMRWANFADVFWYVDAMASKAANGYNVFCRQDFVGIDYGMIDCSTYTPLPDYYAGIIWGRTMGQGVINTTTNAMATGEATYRAYAHCGGPDVVEGSITLVLINLDARPQPPSVLTFADSGMKFPNATVNGVSFALTGPRGTNATLMNLNGQLLQLDNQQRLPSIVGEHITLSTSKTSMSHLQLPQLAPQSVQFIVLPGLGKMFGCRKPLAQCGQSCNTDADCDQTQACNHCENHILGQCVV